MKNEFEKIKNIKMTQGEKEAMLRNIVNSPIPSPYDFQFYMHKVGFSFAALSLVIIVGTVSLASERSLPGDPFYPVKVNLTEPLRGLIETSPEKTANWEAEKAVRRLDEVETLISSGKIDEEKLNDAEKRFNSHKKAFTSEVNIIATSSPKAASDLSNKFKEKVKERSDKIREEAEERGEENQNSYRMENKMEIQVRESNTKNLRKELIRDFINSIESEK